MVTATPGLRMRAIVQDRYGSAEILRAKDIDLPTPDDTSVLVKVRAASVNALDWRWLEGKPRLLRPLLFGTFRPKRRVRGVDVAGVVEAVRRPNSRFKVGDEVFGLGSGSFAEYVAADENEIEPKPTGLAFDEAATLGVAAFTALQGLRDAGRLAAGQSVLITAAGSGVGTFAVQFAKWMGARVTAASSSRNVELLRSLGADDVIDYATPNLQAARSTFDLVLDISGVFGVRALRRALKPGGLIVVVGGRGGIGLFLKAALLRRLFRYPVRAAMAHPDVSDLRLAAQLTLEGKIHPVIERLYSLDEVPKALAKAELHQAAGKLVIHVSG